MKLLVAYIAVCSGLFGFGSLHAQSYFQENAFRTEDFTYDPYIKTVQLYPSFPENSSQLLPAVVPLSQHVPLLLTFDELGSDARVYNAKIIRCEADWTESTLPPMEYLSVYNDFLIREYEFSINTKIPFIHYKFVLPKVKLSGNYVIKVFYENEENLILTRRFMVFEEKAMIDFKQTTAMGGEAALRNQQFQLKVNYTGLQNVINPNRQLKVVVRQNYRWDNAKYDLKPTFVRDHEKVLDFSALNETQAFEGGNEFRMFDFRTQQRFGWRVDSVRYQNNGDRVFLQKEKSRAGFTYGARFDDLNGQFYIETQNNPQKSNTEADYAYVTFVLDADKVAEEVYVFGELSEWRLNPLFKMNYQNGFYTCEVLLKQGIYNYLYVTAQSVSDTNFNDDFFESNYRQTQNTYDVLVYYRPMGARTDYLVGYRKIDEEN